MPILCLGEAIVDLICQREVDSPADANEFRPHFGGALANVAVSARREGADAALLGGTGDDSLGLWLHERLVAEGVDLRWFRLLAGVQTALAITTVDAEREPSFLIYGDALVAGVASAADRLHEALEEGEALIFGSNTLVGEADREVTQRARAEALRLGVPILFDPNLRPARWEKLTVGLQRSREACEGAFAVRCNLEEARWLSGLESAGPADAADAVCRLGARLAVVTTGPGVSVMRGASSAEIAAEPVDVVSPVGAGDAFLGALAAGLASAGWDAASAAQALPRAVAAGANACRSWGAVPDARLG